MTDVGTFEKYPVMCAAGVSSGRAGCTCGRVPRHAVVLSALLLALILSLLPVPAVGMRRVRASDGGESVLTLDPDGGAFSQEMCAALDDAATASPDVVKKGDGGSYAVGFASGSTVAGALDAASGGLTLSRPARDGYGFIGWELPVFTYATEVVNDPAVYHSEYLRWVDLAPAIDQWGVGRYAYEFDLRTQLEGDGRRMRVYMQNGSNWKYDISQSLVPVTTSYAHYHLVRDTRLNTASTRHDTLSYLSFYGTYDTGNVPAVKNLILSRLDVPTEVAAAATLPDADVTLRALWGVPVWRVSGSELHIAMDPEDAIATGWGRVAFDGYASAADVPWHDAAGVITKVVLDETVGGMASTAHWFEGMGALEQIEGLDLLDTTQVTDMTGMFSGCGSLRTLDLSGFDTASVAAMGGMFDGCGALARISLGGRFSFRVSGAVACALPAALADDTHAAGWHWVSDADGRVRHGALVSSDDLAATYDGIAMAGIYLRDVGPTAGEACAALVDGTLTFLRSLDPVETGADKTVTDLYGTSYAGTVYGGVESWRDGDGVAVPWSDELTSITRVVVARGQRIVPRSLKGWFDGASNLVYADLDGIDASLVSSTSCMFRWCTKVTTVDVSGLDTSNVTDLSYMFSKCYALAYLDVSHWNTARVKNMNGVFYDCLVMDGIDVSGWDTSSVTNMASLFGYNGQLKTLDVSNFDTSHVTNMHGMFAGLTSLTRIPGVERLDTSQVTNMQNMFYACKRLQSLDLSHFDTSKVTNMTLMFKWCYALHDLDLTGFDTSRVTGANEMFYECLALGELDLSDFDMGSLASATDMFTGARIEALRLGRGWAAREVPRAALMTLRDGTATGMPAGTAWYRDDGDDDGMTSAELSAAWDPSLMAGWWRLTDEGEATYSIAYDLDGAGDSSLPSGVAAVGGASQPVTARFGATLTVDAPSAPGHTFLGWAISGMDDSMHTVGHAVTAAEGIPSTHATTFAHLRGSPGSVVLSARWAAAGEAAHVIYVGNGGLSGSADTVEGARVAAGLKLADADTFARSDFDFDGWLDELTGMVYEAGSSPDFGGRAGDVVLHAQWSPQPSAGEALAVLLGEGSTVVDGDGSSVADRVAGDLVFLRTLDDTSTFRSGANNRVVTDLAGTTYSGVRAYKGLEGQGAWEGPSGRWHDERRRVRRAYALPGQPVALTSCDSLFLGCENLVSVDFDGLDLSAATDLDRMLSGCAALAELDLTGFATSHVTSMGHMLDGCSALSRIALAQDGSFRPDGGGIADASGQFHFPAYVAEGYTGSWVSEADPYESYGTNYAADMSGVVLNGPYVRQRSIPVWRLTATDNVYDGSSAVELHFAMGGVSHEEGWEAIGNGYSWSVNTTPWLAHKSTIRRVVLDDAITGLTSGNALFYGLSQVSEFVHLDRLDTSRMTSMTDMFSACWSAAEIDVSHFDTSRANNLRYLFQNCSKLTTVDISGFQTPLVTDVYRMFQGCSALKHVELGSVITKKVRQVSGMFLGCNKLAELDLTSCDLSGVTSGAEMLSGCDSLSRVSLPRDGARGASGTWLAFPSYSADGFTGRWTDGTQEVEASTTLPGVTLVGEWSRQVALSVAYDAAGGTGDVVPGTGGPNDTVEMPSPDDVARPYRRLKGWAPTADALMPTWVERQLVKIRELLGASA